MKRKTANQRYYQMGVSLVEVMVGLTIGLIITAGAFMALFSNQKLILEKDRMDRSQESFRFASTTITRMIRQATSFGFPANNNELIVYFDNSQRDCLGVPNQSTVNTFKLNENNELICEIILNDGNPKTVTLAKNISELKFAYGIQNGTGTTPLAYEPYLNSSDTANFTVNFAVDSVWGTITSVLTQISIDDGSGKKPTVDFIATSHLRAMTQLASTGGDSLVNPPSDTGDGNPDKGDGNPDKGDGNPDKDEGDPGKDEGNTDKECPFKEMPSNVTLTANENTVPWSDFIVDKNSKVTVKVKPGINRTGWTIQEDDNKAKPLEAEHTFSLNGNSKIMTLTLKCGSVTNPITISSKGKEI